MESFQVNTKVQKSNFAREQPWSSDYPKLSLAEQGVKSSNSGPPTWISEDRYLLLPSRNMIEILLM